MHVGDVLGIPIWVRFSCIFTLVILTVILGAVFFPETVAGANPSLCWMLGLIGTFVFFACTLVHELAHCLVARRQNTPVYGIVMNAMGGQAHMHPMFPGARAEFMVAAAGPAINALIIALCIFIVPIFDPAWSTSTKETVTPFQSIVLWTMIVNLLTGAINLIPAFPIDGGRMLHAIVWGVTGSWNIATTLVCGLARVFAYGMIVCGATGFFVFPGWRFFSLSFVPVGFFVNSWAALTARQAKAQRVLQRHSAMDVMALPADSDELGVAEAKGQNNEPLIDASLSSTRVSPDTDALTILGLMETQRVDEVRVIEGDRFIGHVRKGQILQLLASSGVLP